MAVCQKSHQWLTDRYREQAHSYKCSFISFQPQRITTNSQTRDSPEATQMLQSVAPITSKCR